MFFVFILLNLMLKIVLMIKNYNVRIYKCKY
jgi:hypothetical protein